MNTLGNLNQARHPENCQNGLHYCLSYLRKNFNRTITLILYHWVQMRNPQLEDVSVFFETLLLT